MREAMNAKLGAAKNQSGKGKKRKAAEIEKAKGESVVNGHDSKRQKTSGAPAAPKTSAAVAAMARKVADSLVEEELKRKTVMSDAVASLYGPKERVTSKKETFMTMGTFTRVSETQFTNSYFAECSSVRVARGLPPRSCLLGPNEDDAEHFRGSLPSFPHGRTRIILYYYSSISLWTRWSQ